MKNISKNLVGFVFTLLVLVSCFVFSSKALAVVNPTLTINPVSVVGGSNISVPILVSNWKNKVAGMDILVSYDPTILSIDSITQNNNLSGALFNEHYSNNLIYLSYLADVNTLTIDNGILATLNFTVIADANTTTNLNFKTSTPGLRSKLFDKYGSSILTNFVGGLVTLTPAPPKVIKKIPPVLKTIPITKNKGIILDNNVKIAK